MAAVKMKPKPAGPAEQCEQTEPPPWHHAMKPPVAECLVARFWVARANLEVQWPRATTAQGVKVYTSSAVLVLWDEGTTLFTGPATADPNGDANFMKWLAKRGRAGLAGAVDRDWLTADKFDQVASFHDGEYHINGKVVREYNRGDGKVSMTPAGLLHVVAWEQYPKAGMRPKVAYAWEWKKGKFNRKIGPTGTPDSLVETEGWVYGNVGLHQEGERRAKQWSMTHAVSGLSCGAVWSGLKKAKLGVEVIREAVEKAGMSLADLDNYDTLDLKEQRVFTVAIKAHRESV